MDGRTSSAIRSSMTRSLVTRGAGDAPGSAPDGSRVALRTTRVRSRVPWTPDRSAVPPPADAHAIRCSWCSQFRKDVHSLEDCAIERRRSRVRPTWCAADVHGSHASMVMDRAGHSPSDPHPPSQPDLDAPLGGSFRPSMTSQDAGSKGRRSIASWIHDTTDEDGKISRIPPQR